MYVLTLQRVVIVGIQETNINPYNTKKKTFLKWYCWCFKNPVSKFPTVENPVVKQGDGRFPVHDKLTVLLFCFL